MKVTKELIEKYHQGLCSAEEARTIENWLLEPSEDESLLLSQEEKQKHKKEIWTNISQSIPKTRKETFHFTIQHYLTPAVQKGIAASFILGLLGMSIFWWWHQNIRIHSIAISNNENIGSEKIQTQGLDIFLGAKSQANINASAYHKRGNIDFCGIILINPNEDIELTLNTKCKNPVNAQEKMMFKKGQKYFAVNYHFNTDDELIVVSERNLTNLPPALQRAIMKQFNI